MKRVLLAILGATAISASAQNYTHQRIGNFDYYSGSDGYSGTGQSIGNFYYYNDNQGNNWTGQRIGNFDYWNNNRFGR
jgi:hypothetical protein